VRKAVSHDFQFFFVHNPNYIIIPALVLE
jgi:hypothetical protein